jgi:nitrogen fixation protein FixH
MSAMSHPDPRRSRWIPWLFVGGMALVVVVNGVMAYFALSTFTGVTVAKSYERGRGYNQVLEEAARQQALGWQAELALAAGRLSVRVADREGLPVAGRLDGVLLRPLEGTTRPLDLVATAPGRWTAEAPSLAPGQWEARLVLHGPGEARLDIRKRLLAP